MAPDHGRVHALIVGISAYPHLTEGAPTDGPTLGLRSLQSAARAAFCVHEWIAGHGFAGRAPGDLQLLVAPSELEAAEEPAVATATSPCTWKAVAHAANHWREVASEDSDDVALFYFAGHGLQRGRGDHVLLLEDFGDGEGAHLHRAVDSDTLIGGMTVAEERPNMARLQFYVFDACRDTHKTLTDRYEKTDVTPLWDVPKVENVDRAARRTSVLYTAGDGMLAYGIAGHQSIFSEALLACLGGSAACAYDDEYGERRWHVTGTSLQRGLNSVVDRLNADYGTQQRFEIRDGSGELVLNELSAPPPAQLRVSVTPEEAVDWAAVDIVESDTATTIFSTASPFHPHPFSKEVPAGYYDAHIAVSPPDDRPHTRRRAKLVEPPATDFVIQAATPAA
ncbi:MAG TPA: caspase family protein [Solirubrobacteraceae bacterium]|jgi:hypothetical protein